MLWYCLQKFNLSSITHKYLEKGHTFNENDSVHSIIETASKNIPHNPNTATVRNARPKRPYKVKEMTIQDLFYFKKVAENIKNFEINTKNDKIQWSKIRVLKLTSSNPNLVLYKTDYEEETFQVIDLLERLRQRDVPCPKSLPLVQLNQNKQEISCYYPIKYLNR